MQSTCPHLCPVKWPLAFVKNFITKKLNMQKQIIFTLLTMLMTGASLFSQDNKVFKTEDGVAINGYDAVAYFTQNQAVQGSKQFSISHNGATYYFANAEHQTAFKADPAKYAPVCGGYCAFAVAKMGALVPSDPKTFKIRDGKLYLFYNDLYEGEPFNTVIPWNAEEASLVPLMEKNWKTAK